MANGTPSALQLLLCQALHRLYGEQAAGQGAASTNSRHQREQRGAPSTVTTCMPSTAYSGHRHALTDRCSSEPSSATLDTITVHAPHPPSPHPSFVPVSPISARSTKLCLGGMMLWLVLDAQREESHGGRVGAGSHTPAETGMP